jgi:excinuclease ABC subunit B
MAGHPYASVEAIEAEVSRLEKDMKEAARQFEFEKAAALRDQARKLKKMAMDLFETPEQSP